MYPSSSSLSSLPFTSSFFISLDIVDSHLLNRFDRAGIKNLTDLSAYTPLELSLKFRLPLNDAEKIINKLFSFISLRSTNVYNMLMQTATLLLPTKLPTLDGHLNGGLRRGSLVELCGSWGSGKTQFCLHLTAQCCLLGLRSIYIDTEHTFSAARLLNMIGGVHGKQEYLLELVRTETAFDATSLMHTLQLIETELDEEHITQTIDRCPVLLVVDSIAAPLRMSALAGYNRDNTLLAFTDCAKRLATRYNMLILVTNQVTTKRRSNVLSEKSDENFSSVSNNNSGNDFYMSIALGKAWSHSVNVRLAISYQGDTRRQLIVGKSIESPGHTVSFRILTSGLEEIVENSDTNNLRRRSEKTSAPQLIQADEMHLVGKQLRP